MGPISKKPSQLLEINIISGQDLEPVSKKMRTYAMSWMNPNRKLVSRVDVDGNNNPTWNDKFVFKVDDDFLHQDTSAVMIEIYSKHWFRDVLVGTVRVLLGNLIPSHSHNETHIGVRFVALQIRRPSGRPQGILNVGVALLDSNMRGMQLYRQLSMSAIGCRDLIEDPPTLHDSYPPEPTLRRSRSERSRFDNFSPGSSIIALPPPLPPSYNAKENSIISITETLVPIKGMKKTAGKASSVINWVERPDNHRRPRKASSVVGAYVISKDSVAGGDGAIMGNESEVGGYENLKPPPPPPPFIPRPVGGYEKGNSILSDSEVGPSEILKPPPQLPFIPRPDRYEPKKGNSILSDSEVGPSEILKPPPQLPFIPRPAGRYEPKNGNSILSNSEIGPSPSEVAAAIMAERMYPLNQDNESSMLDGWSLDESVEGLRSKLERWRMELPPLYDNGSFTTSSHKSSSRRSRRSTASDNGKFSFFGNIFGYECQCICGQPQGKKTRSGRLQKSPSASTTGGSSFS